MTEILHTFNDFCSNSPLLKFIATPLSAAKFRHFPYNQWFFIFLTLWAPVPVAWSGGIGTLPLKTFFVEIEDKERIKTALGLNTALLNPKTSAQRTIVGLCTTGKAGVY